MSHDEEHGTADDRSPESFLVRWSRRKQEARAPEQADRPADPAPTVQAAPDAIPESAPPAAPLPDIEQLDQDSDYRAFLAPGVDAELRRRALRKLFRGPKFNVLDGLDIYQDDFRNFEPLGDMVTADMRHQVEVTARRIAASLQDEPTGIEPMAATEAVAPTSDDEPDRTATTPAEVDDDDHQRDA